MKIQSDSCGSMWLGTWRVRQACEQAAEGMALGGRDLGHRVTYFLGLQGHVGQEREIGICLENTSTAVSHVGKETSVPTQAPFHPTASWSRRAGGEAQPREMKEGDQMTGTFSTVPRSCWHWVLATVPTLRS